MSMQQTTGMKIASRLLSAAVCGVAVTWLVCSLEACAATPRIKDATAMMRAKSSVPETGSAIRTCTLAFVTESRRGRMF